GGGRGHERRLYGRFNGQPFETAWRPMGNSAAVNVKVGPFRHEWGRPGSLELTVEKARFFLKGRTRVSGTVSDERFLPARAHGTVSMVCANGRTVDGVLECPAAVPPPPQPYPQR